MLIAEIGTVTINTPLDYYCVSLAAPFIKAKRELSEYFKPVMNEDRAFNLGNMVHFGDEAKAMKYVTALTISKANKYGSPSAGR